MPLSVPIPEINIDNLSPDINISLPAAYGVVLPRKFAVTTNITITLGLKSYLRVL